MKTRAHGSAFHVAAVMPLPWPMQDALHPAGAQADGIGALWNLTLVLCAAVFLAIVAATAVALLRAPRASRDSPADLDALDRPEPAIRRNVGIAVAVSAVPLVGLILADTLTDRRLSRLPLTDAVTIDLTGHMWWWEATYTDAEPARRFTTANELHVPVGRPVIVTLGSADVIHSFWAPNLHGKKDLLPGRTATIRFRVDRPGTYRGQCAEFCGLEHALMSFIVQADAPDRYADWAQAQRAAAPAPRSPAEERGRQVFLSRTCVMCHAIQGTSAGAVLGPDLTHVAGRAMLASGVLPNDRAHLAAWILDPQAVKPGANMPPTRLAPDELDDLLSYLAILK